MALGSSAGRSAGNRTAEEAPRRATQRERAYIDPPLDQLVPVEERAARWQLTPRGEKLADALAWGLWLGFCVFFAVIVCAWWGLL
jgi:hypothetical protein